MVQLFFLLRNGTFDGKDCVFWPASKGCNQAVGCLRLLPFIDGAARAQDCAARLGASVSFRSLRDWGDTLQCRGPDGLINGKAPRQVGRCWKDDQRSALSAKPIDAAPHLISDGGCPLASV